MGNVVHDLFIYLLGGVTFIPLTLLAVFIHGWLTFGSVQENSPSAGKDRLSDPTDDGHNIQHGGDALDPKLHRSQEKEHAGYFAVCREWVPGGISSKPPPERTTPIGEGIGEESPSVYQSMYRSLFDRKHGPTMEVARPNGRNMRKANNIFYVVLRHGHLMLYDDSEQVEVRYVISLAQHDITVYGGDGEISEGELWIRRNAIRLSRKVSLSDSIDMISKPFFLFSENCSEKEDFYFALLQNQERDGKDNHPAPLVQHHETKHILGLLQRLHSSEEQLQTRWFNALLGRLFLGIYKTPEFEAFLREKITKKIARANKPGFLSNIVLRKIDLGEAAPFITNPKLKDLMADGECCVEADLAYEGKFRIEIGASARIDLGSRFKAREVNFVLAITVKKVEGHIYVRFKPPPSNRLWYAFEKMPQLNLQIEPIVSSRQITYNIILRAIESRIREVFAETLVIPHWDDAPFFHTEDQFHRGGIWINEKRDFQPPTETIIPDEVEQEPADGSDAVLEVPVTQLDQDKAISPTPTSDGQRQRIFSWKSNKSSPALPQQSESATSTSFQKGNEPPKAIRSKQFAAAAGPVTSTDNINRDPMVKVNKKKRSKDAASVMSEISSRSQPTSPIANPARPILDDVQPLAAEVDGTNNFKPPEQSMSTQRDRSESQTSAQSEQSIAAAHSRSASVLSDTATQTTRLQSLAKTFTPSEKKQQSLGAAALAARNWGWKTISKPKQQLQQQPSSSIMSSEKLGTPDNPIGRGQPLPPPGQPLPLPDNKRSASFQLSSRKAPPPELPTRPREVQNGSISTPDEPAIPRSAPPPQININSPQPAKEVREFEDLLVVAAPTDSGPPSPAANDDHEYGEFMENVHSSDAESPRRERGSGSAREQRNKNLDTPQEKLEGSEIAVEYTRDTAGSRGESLHLAEDSDLATENQVLKDAEGNERHSDLANVGTDIVHEVHEDEDHTLSSWKSAQEEEERSKGIWTQELEIPIA